METNLSRYLFDLSRIPTHEREKYLKLIDGMSYSGADMVDRNGHYCAWYESGNITRLHTQLPANLSVFPYPPGCHIDEI